MKTTPDALKAAATEFAYAAELLNAMASNTLMKNPLRDIETGREQPPFPATQEDITATIRAGLRNLGYRL